jgi:hypothetical protein
MKICIICIVARYSPVEPSPLILRPLLAYCTSPEWEWVWNSRRMIDKGNRNTRWKPVPVLLCPPQIPDTGAQTRSSSVRSQWLTVWATARPPMFLLWKEESKLMTLPCCLCTSMYPFMSFYVSPRFLGLWHYIAVCAIFLIFEAYEIA